jgi:hypothetical protein
MKQIRIIQKSENELRVYIKQNNFFAGIINLKSRIFFHVPRSSKNVFQLFSKPGLGINEDILLRKDFDKIMIKFNDEILETTRLNWLRNGIASPYCNSIVDKQIILSISKITLQDAVDTPEKDLFSEVI